MKILCCDQEAKSMGEWPHTRPPYILVTLYHCEVCDTYVKVIDPENRLANVGEAA